MAHDLIHMILAQLHCADWSKSVSFPVWIGRTEWGLGPEVWGHRSNCHHCAGWHKTKRPGLGLSHKALSRSALPQVLLKHRIEPSLLRVNGTEVPDDITLRPCWNSPPCLNLYRLVAGHLRER
jgi:hypothetical protein